MEAYTEPGNPASLRPLAASDLASLTGWPLRRVYEAARLGTLPVIRVGRRVFFPRPAVLALLAAGEEAARA